jgi:hypothetical protein
MQATSEVTTRVTWRVSTRSVETDPKRLRDGGAERESVNVQRIHPSFYCNENIDLQAVVRTHLPPRMSPSLI